MTTSITPVVLCPTSVVPLTVATPFITGAPGVQTTITRAFFTNITAGAVSIGVYRVPSGGSAVSGTIIIPARSIAANGTDLAPELAGMVLAPGDTIQCEATSAAAINITASGFITS